MTDSTPPSAAFGPLDGIKVIEVASVVLGPLAGQYLGDMGADVIKIEPPDGDLTRSLGPQRNPGFSAVFLNCNRNKRSVVLDLRQERDRAVLQALVAKADVFLHSIRSSAALRMGIDYATLSAVNPGLVYCHCKGFDDRGVYGGMPAYDDVIQSLSGIAALQSDMVGSPRYIPTIYADKVSALHAAYGVMLGLFHRIRTARRPYATRDGFIAFLPYTDSHWTRFFKGIERPELMHDERFRSYGARQKHFAEVWAFVEDALTKKTNAEWLALYGGGDMPIAAVNRLDDLTRDPHLESTGFWRMLDHKTEGLLRVPEVPFGMSDSPPRLRRMPPALGEHTREVFEEFGIPLDGR
jgi:crotonobetainyl-CoA:carnitine CoA-transferase CaiB-like acyl-CoA transferase